MDLKPAWHMSLFRCWGCSGKKTEKCPAFMDITSYLRESVIKSKQKWIIFFFISPTFSSLSLILLDAFYRRILGKTVVVHKWKKNVEMEHMAYPKTTKRPAYSFFRALVRLWSGAGIVLTTLQAREMLLESSTEREKLDLVTKNVVLMLTNKKKDSRI